MATPSPLYLGTIRGIDKFTEYSVYLFCLLNIPLIGSNTFEVISRYGFGEPTEWALDVTTQAEILALLRDLRQRVGELQAHPKPAAPPPLVPHTPSLTGRGVRCRFLN